MSGPNKKKSMNVPYARDRRAVEADHKRSRSFIDLQHSRTNGSAGLNVNAKPYMKLEPGAPQYVFTQQQGYSGPADVSGQSDFDSYSSFVQPQQQNNFSAYFSGAQNTYLQQGTTQADYSVNQHTQTDYNNNGGNTSRDHDIHIQQQRQQLLQQQQQRQQQQQQHQHQTREFQSSSGLPQNQYGNQHKPGDTLNMLNLESQARNINNPEVGTFPTAIITASDNTHAAHSYYAGNLATGSSPMPNFHTGAYNFDMGLVKPDTTLDDDFQSLLDSAHLSAFDEADFDMSMMRNRAYAKLDGLVQPVHSVQSPTDTKLSVGDNAAHSVCSGESGDYDHVLRGDEMRVAAQLLEDTKQEPPDSVFQGYEPVQFFLDAPNSIARKLTDGALSYLNVGLVYNISAKKIPGNTVGSDPVHTIISLLIDGKDDNSVVHWEQWQKTCAAQFNMNSANHPHSGAKIGMTSAPTRPINALATKAQGITNLTKPRINSLSFYWTPSEGFKLPIQVYCLSTDFVTQKGVAGMPFKIQVDILNAKSTGTESLYRSQCLIKVFRPNGAERKHKEESKSEEKRLLKHMKKSGPAVFTNPFFQESKYTTFTSIPALGPPPVQFADKPLDSLPLVATGDVMGVLSEFNIDSTMFTETQAHRDKRQYISSPVSAGEEHPNSNATSEGRRSQNYCGSPGAAKKAWSRPADYTTLYLKIEDEEAYHAIYLYEKDLDELKLKIAQRYHKSAENIRKIYKRTKKGILVNVDSEMVARIEDESDFILTLKEDPVTSADSFYCIICPNFGDPIPSSTKRQSKKRLSSSHSSASRSSSIKSLSPPVIANTDLLDENHDESD